MRGTGIARDDEAQRLMMRKLNYGRRRKTSSGEKEKEKTGEGSAHPASLMAAR
jgi:hypothetical protein